MQYNTIQYNTIQYNAVQYNTNNAVQCNTVQYNTMQYNAIQYNTIQCSAIQYKTIRYNAVQCNTMQYVWNEYRRYRVFGVCRGLLWCTVHWYGTILYCEDRVVQQCCVLCAMWCVLSFYMCMCILCADIFGRLWWLCLAVFSRLIMHICLFFVMLCPVSVCVCLCVFVSCFVFAALPQSDLDGLNVSTQLTRSFTQQCSAVQCMHITNTQGAGWMDEGCTVQWTYACCPRALYTTLCVLFFSIQHVWISISIVCHNLPEHSFKLGHIHTHKQQQWFLTLAISFSSHHIPHSLITLTLTVTPHSLALTLALTLFQSISPSLSRCLILSVTLYRSLSIAHSLSLTLVSSERYSQINPLSSHVCAR